MIELHLEALPTWYRRSLLAASTLSLLACLVATVAGS